MFSLISTKDGQRKVIIESKDYMDIVEYIMQRNYIMTDRESRRLFYDINTKGKHTMKNGNVLELKELLF